MIIKWPSKWIKEWMNTVCVYACTYELEFIEFPLLCITLWNIYTYILQFPQSQMFGIHILLHSHSHCTLFMWSEVAQSCPTLCDPMDYMQPTRLLCPWDFPGNSTGVDCHFLLQGIFPTQGLNPGLPHCRQTLNRLSHQGSREVCFIPNSSPYSESWDNFPLESMWAGGNAHAYPVTGLRYSDWMLTQITK